MKYQVNTILVNASHHLPGHFTKPEGVYPTDEGIIGRYQSESLDDLTDYISEVMEITTSKKRTSGMVGDGNQYGVKPTKTLKVDGLFSEWWSQQNEWTVELLIEVKRTPVMAEARYKLGSEKPTHWVGLEGGTA